MIDSIIKGIFEKKGHEVVCIDMTKAQNAICSYFVICHGDSNTQVSAIAESIEEETCKQLQRKPESVQGMQNAEWVLLDYGEAIVHVFQKNIREHYKLEELWGDYKITHIDDNSKNFNE